MGWAPVVMAFVVDVVVGSMVFVVAEVMVWVQLAGVVVAVVARMPIAGAAVCRMEHIATIAITMIFIMTNIMLARQMQKGRWFREWDQEE